MIKSGIYITEGKTHHKIYIGSSIDVYKRWARHKWELRKRLHDNVLLQRAWDKYGENDFVFHFMQPVGNINILREKEQAWIDLFVKFVNSKNSLYNTVVDIGNPRLFGRKTKTYTEEMRVFDSERMMGNKYAVGKSHPQTPEIRKKISEKLKGTRHSDESYLRQSLKMIGRIPSNAKLDDSKVIEIRELYKNGSSVNELSTRFNLHCTTIRNAVNRKTWKHIL